jgi:hypothetical protein
VKVFAAKLAEAESVLMAAASANAKTLLPKEVVVKAAMLVKSESKA